MDSGENKTFSYCRSYSTLSIASSRSSLASDLHDAGTPVPSSPVPPPPPPPDMPPASSISVPPEDSLENQEKHHSRSPTPQPELQPQLQPLHLQGEKDLDPSSALDGTEHPKINVQSADGEYSTVLNPTSTVEDSTQKISMTEGGTQVDVEATTSNDGGDDFGDFQMVERVTEAATAAAVGSGTEVHQATTEDSQGKVKDVGETQPSLSTNLTDTTTNLQQIATEIAAVTGTCV